MWTKTAEAKSTINWFKRKANVLMEKELTGDDDGEMGKPSSDKLEEIQ